MNKADLRRADLAGANLHEAMLYAADLDGAGLAGADLTNALMGTAHFTRSDLTKAILRNVDLRKARLPDAILLGADLSMAALDFAILRSAKLDGATLTDARMIGSEFSEASLRGAVLTDADASGANFRGADLSRANLAGTSFRKGEFYDTVLDEAVFKDTVCPTAPAGRDAACGLRLGRENLELCRAFELAFGHLARLLRIEAALAALAEKIHLQHDPAPVPASARSHDCLMNRSPTGVSPSAAGCSMQSRLPSMSNRASHLAAEQIGLVAGAQVGVDGVVAIIGTRIRHDPDALEHAVVVEERGDDHRKGLLGGAGPARDLAVEIARPRDIFVFVVVFEIDLVQSVRLRAAALEIAPAFQPQARRAAIRSAGKAAVLVGGRLRRQRLADLEVPDSVAPQLLRPGGHRSAQEGDARSGARRW